MPRCCINKVDNFCYICGEVTLSSQKRKITPHIRKLYRHYFECAIGDQDKPWAPHICCLKCVSTLSGWAKGYNRAMPFAVPMVWREPTNHNNDCYFCMTPPVSGIRSNRKSTLVYPSIPSAIRPIPHDDLHPIPKFTSTMGK